MSFQTRVSKRAFVAQRDGVFTLVKSLAIGLGLAALSGSAWAQSTLTLAWGASGDSSVIGYRLYCGGASQVYTNVVDVGNITSNTVSSLTMGGTYYFAVTAYDSVGLESAFSNEISYGVPSTNVPAPVSTISFAADSAALTAPFIASNGIIWQTLQTVLPSGGQAVYSFTVTNAGNYVISAPVNAPSQGANSFYLNIDAQPTDPVMIWDIQPLTSGFENRTVCWRGNGTDVAPQIVPKVFNLSAGTHQLIIRGREANTQLGRLTVSPFFAITNLVRPANGNVTVTGSGVANATCVLQAVSSLTPPLVWTSISTNVSDGQGRFSCNDPASTSFPSRFYRVLGR